MAKKSKSNKKEDIARPIDFDTIRSPFMTEKSTVLSTQGNTVVFEVDRRASKLEIAEAVSRIFKVQVSKVRTVNYLGKTKRSIRGLGRQAGYKKAYVTLKEGSKINLVEGL